MGKVNINTPEYFDKQFEQRQTMSGNLRQIIMLDMLGTGETIVELGCGISPFPVMALQKFDYVFACDFAPKTIDKLTVENTEIIYDCCDILKTNYQDCFFDVVVCAEVIEHLEQPDFLIKEMLRICRPDGKLLITSPQLEFDDPEHLKEYTINELCNFLKPYGKLDTKTVDSEYFPGRKYNFVLCYLN